MQTLIFVIASVCVFLGSWFFYDIYAVAEGAQTITQAIQKACLTPAVPFLTGLLLGLLLGHLFLQF